jgi:hypothetical protein
MKSDLPITNPERAERARKALEAFSDEYDPVANMIDFLADLQHYCNEVDIGAQTFDDLLSTSRRHFDAEINGEE